MRIAIVNWTSRPAGGSGTYLRAIVPALSRRGHEIGFWHELGGPPDGEPFALPSGSPSWSVEQIGLERALAGMREWRPGVLFAHGLLDPEVEARTLQVAPAVFLAHGYYGTCISGAKMFKSPTNVPCSRTFGWPCLAHYYPRHCGGWNAGTMVRDFRRQAARLSLLSRYKTIMTLSTHMQQEYARHGLEATAVKGAVGPGDRAAKDQTERSPHDEWQLLVAGRMEHVKGGQYLLDALPRVARALDRRISVTFAGDGPARAAWQAVAATLTAREPTLRITFSGWLDRERVDNLMTVADLLVLPSLWPEPFGLVGLEAGQHGVPVAAFAVGGIPDWLRHGVNGILAPGDPPTAAGLGEAIVRCLSNPETYAGLRRGAAQVEAEFGLEQHADGVVRILEVAARS